LEGFVTKICLIGVYGKDTKERKNEIFDKTAGLIRSWSTTAPRSLCPSAARDSPMWSIRPTRQGDRRAGAEHQR